MPSYLNAKKTAQAVIQAKVELRKKGDILKFAKAFFNLFDLKEPIINDIEFLDIILEDHALFMVSWQFKKAYSIRISKTKKKYKSAIGAFIVRLPSESISVEVVVSNTWKKKRFNIELTKKKLDKRQAATLIRNIPYISFQNINQFDIRIENLDVKCTIPTPCSILSEIELTIPQMTITNEHFKYTPI